MMRWEKDTSLYAITEGKHGRTLFFILKQAPLGDWMCVALEVPTPSDGERVQLRAAGPGAAIQRVLDDHAHTLLPASPSLEQAKKLCERYARWWRGTRAVAFDCTCIAIRRPKRRRLTAAARSGVRARAHREPTLREKSSSH